MGNGQMEHHGQGDGRFGFNLFLLRSVCMILGSCLFSFFFFKLIYIYFERERERAREGQREREGERESQAGSALSVQSLTRGARTPGV